IDLGQAFLGLYEDESVHPVGDMHAHRCRGAVVDVESRVFDCEGEHRGVSGCRHGGLSTATWAGHGMQVDVVRELVIGMVVQMELDKVAFAYTDELTGYGATERPEGVLDARSDLFDELLDFHVYDHLGGVFTGDGRRDFG